MYNRMKLFNLKKNLNSVTLNPTEWSVYSVYTPLESNSENLHAMPKSMDTYVHIYIHIQT